MIYGLNGSEVVANTIKLDNFYVPASSFSLFHPKPKRNMPAQYWVIDYCFYKHNSGNSIEHSRPQVLELYNVHKYDTGRVASY